MFKKRNVVAGLLLAAAALVISVGCANAEEAIQLKTSKEIPASIFGTQTHFGQWWDYKEVLPLIEKAGFKWIADEIHWGSVEKEKGVLKIPAKADWVNDAVRRGINIQIGLVYGNKHYPYELSLIHI